MPLVPLALSGYFASLCVEVMCRISSFELCFRFSAALTLKLGIGAGYMDRVYYSSISLGSCATRLMHSTTY